MDKYTGTVLKDRYVLENVLGVGGMAVVYRASDKVTGNTVAVKILKDEFVSDEQFRRRFLNESRAISMLRHRNIVSVIDFEFEGNIQYIVMEYIDGITLKDFMRAQKALPFSIACKIAMQILSALQHAHERGIVHRDIKPQNIMLLSDGTIKVMDFGIARISKFETVTMTDKAIGTVYYISPEQAKGEKTDQRSDIYSTGVMLYEMLTGTLAFDGDTPVSVALKQIQTSPEKPTVLNDQIPLGLEQIVLKAMLKTPDKRYQSAAEMVNDLRLILQDPEMLFNFDLTDEFLTDGGLSAISEDPEIKLPFWTKGNIIAMAAGLVAGLIVIFVVFFLLSGNNKKPEGTPSESEPTEESQPEAEQVTVPQLIGDTYEEIMANTEITGNFTITKEDKESADFEVGYVFEQSIEAGTLVNKGSEIIVSVSSGANEVTFPDLTGELQEDAENTLNALEIEYKIVQQSSDTVKEGYVIKTTPEGTVKDGEVVYVYVSSGQNIIKNIVPNVTGKHIEQAKFLIENSGFVFDVIEGYSASVEKDYIIVQYIPAESELEEGSTVTVIVSLGPEPAPEPEPEPEPESSKPESSAPESSEPESSEPESSVPEVSEPEESVPEESVPEESEVTE